MQDGKGALYFVKPIHECSENFPGPPRPFMKPQATKMTRDDMRKHSPSGEVEMKYELDQQGKYLIATGIIFSIGLVIAYSIDWSLLLR